MTRFIFALALTILLIGRGLAQPAPLNSIPPGHILQGRYVQERHLVGLDAPLRSEGRFVIAPDRGLIWRSERPFNIATVVTRDNLVQIVEQSQTMRLTASRAPFLRHFYNLLMGALTGSWETIEQTFTIRREAIGATWRADLSPVSGAAADAIQISRVHLEGSTFVELVEIFRSNGDWERLTFQDQNVATVPMISDDLRLIETVGE